MSSLPPPDPAEGHTAFMEAEGVRKEASTALTDGSLSLEELFAQVDAEAGPNQLGHMHIRHALIALPFIGEVKANLILDGLKIEHGKHLVALGSNQRREIVQEVLNHSPSPDTPPQD